MVNVILPKPNTRDQTEVIECSSLIIIGANGSGKSRLGIQIEATADRNGQEVHRIGAQRSLVFRERITPKSTHEAQVSFLYGHFPENPKWNLNEVVAHAKQQKEGSRWGSRPESHLLNDYDHVLSLLIANEHLRNSKVTKQAVATGIKPAEVPKSPLDRAFAVWQAVMPHRELELDDNRIYGRAPGGDRYSGLGMSDGERVAFYLIAQAMCVPPNSLVIVDEPEVHLHKAIQTILWDAIERERADCTFIYITHDLEFAASHPDATIIWAKSFNGSVWDWVQVDPIDGFPTDLTLQILGCRKPVLFVEGTAESIDTNLYRRIYPEYHVLPRGSCHKVIESTRALRSADGFHGTQAFGLIDRDFRSDAELNALEKDGVLAIPVAEVENMFCMECVLGAAAMHEEKSLADVMREVRRTVVAEFKNALVDQATKHSRHEVHHLLSQFDGKSRNRDEFVGSVTKFTAKLDPEAVFDHRMQRLQDALNSENYAEILSLFNRKGLYRQLCQFTGKTVEHFPRWVLRELDKASCCENPSPIGVDLLKTLREEFPKFATSSLSKSELQGVEATVYGQ